MPSNEITIKWTPFALSCLDDIHDYITSQEKSSKPANHLIEIIFDKVEQLAIFPESGQKEPLLLKKGQENRYLVAYSYKIIYQYLPSLGAIVITDVFHTSQYPIKIRRSLK